MQAKKNYDKELEFDQPQRDSSSPETQAKRVSWIVALIIIIISVFIAIICSAIYNQQPALPIEYDYVISNWQTSPIYAITPSASGCTEYFTAYQFPGTVDGCDCTSSPSVKYSNNIFASQCSQEQLSNGCKSVNSTPQTTFTQWQLQSQILQLCVTRIKGFNYMQSDCSVVGYQRCGVAQGDTTNPNMFCLPASAQCPINSIIYGATAPDTSYVSIINVGTQKIFTSSSVVNSQPLAFSHISRGNGECKDFQNYHYIDPNMNEYQLMRGKSNTCTSSQTDPRFQQLFQITESTYFSANSYDVSNLPQYPLSQNMQYYFLTRSYIPWQQLGNCRYTHMPYFINLKSNLDTISNLWIGCIIVNWFVAILYGGLASALRLKLTWKIKNWYIIPTIILLLIQTIMTVLTFAYAVYNNNKISSMNNAQCSDVQTNNMISSFSSSFNTSVLTYQIVLLVFVLVLNIFTIFFMKTIFIIIRNSSGKEVILPQQQTTSKVNFKESSNRNKKKVDYHENDQDHNLLEDRGQVAGGFDNTYQPNSNADANTLQYQHVDGASDVVSNMNSNNINANANTINQETINVPLVVKVNDNLEGNKQKGVLKKGANQPPGQNLQIIQPNNNQNGGINIKVTKFDNDNNQTYQTKDQELENLYQQITNTDLSGNKRNDNNNSNNYNNNSQNKQGGGKMTLDVQGNNMNKNNSNNNINSRNNLDMQLNILSGNNVDKYQNNESHFIPEPVKSQQPSAAQIAYQESQDQQAIKSFANMEGLMDKEDWEFEIDDYVKKHRENQQSHNRIGGGYEIGKPREKYLGHKFKKSHTRRFQQQSSMEFDQDIGKKTQQNLLGSQVTINQMTTNQINNQEIVENLDDYDSQSNNQKLP
ncbi:transmembrane protein, putative (macronuclear) [Tetrahymena thermophila SB210]|uniref:Transmembrane protein, putative n=1 Tax=Tetrahymena thermophila (strain SB210) TaxID=312017 RepID=Q248F7_TETTS|nr:transmembrane protein, putative [Tetrahymena thermophila SB210]EAS04088.1 transmembrane protein, putative [Tetrahymena thermophila SB210]|eukprot:XP_001024333.1 transmembrane protein, putative [Tetrahymena thermophila SB210]